jgi:hypothetical protein
VRAGASVSPRPSSASPLPPEGPVAPSASASPGPVSFVAPDLEPGIYEITLEAYDGIDRIRTSPVALTLQAPTASPIARRPEIDQSSNRWIFIAATIAALMAIAGTLFVRRRRSL